MFTERSCFAFSSSSFVATLSNIVLRFSVLILWSLIKAVRTLIVFSAVLIRLKISSKSSAFSWNVSSKFSTILRQIAYASKNRRYYLRSNYSSRLVSILLIVKIWVSCSLIGSITIGVCAWITLILVPDMLSLLSSLLLSFWSSASSASFLSSNFLSIWVFIIGDIKFVIYFWYPLLISLNNSVLSSK